MKNGKKYTDEELVEIILEHHENKSKPKLIIHETECHGCGKFYYNGKWDYYSYDDGEWGDVKTAVIKLIDIGFIKYEDVAIFTDDDNIYELVEKGLNVK